MKPRTWIAPALLAAACAAGPPGPASLQPGVSCAHCRMTVLDQRLSAQIVAPGDDPLFFDDIGCLAEYLKNHRPPADARAYVADHTSGAWIPANGAAFSRSTLVATPMGSHIIAHTDEAARHADSAAETAGPLSVDDVFGPEGPPGGHRAR